MTKSSLFRAWKNIFVKFVPGYIFITVLNAAIFVTKMMYLRLAVHRNASASGVFQKNIFSARSAANFVQLRNRSNITAIICAAPV